MGALLVAVACLAAFGPAAMAATFGLGVPPQQGILFGATTLVLSVVAALAAFQQRYRIWRASAHEVGRVILPTGLCVTTSLVAYLLVYNWCVVEHPMYTGKWLVPLWPTGRLAEMIEKAGSRYGAIETYGPAAVFDAASERPSDYGITITALLLLYGPALAATSGVVVLMALRQPIWQGSSPLAAAAYDVFISYNRADVLAVRAIGKELTDRKLRCFIDERENLPGQDWTTLVERAIETSRACIVVLGPHGIGPWQAIEIQNVAETRLRRGVSVIPVLLPDTPAQTRPPMQLAGLTWVDMRKSHREAIDELVRGVVASSSGRAD